MIVGFIAGFFITLIAFIAIFFICEINEENRLAKWEGASWHWHRGCKCTKCGKLYSRPSKVPEYCHKCGGHDGYYSVVLRWRPFRLEVLNEDETEKED